MEPRRTDLAAALVIYVLPLTLVVVGLFAVGLPQLAIALLLIEVVVLGAVVLVRRRPVDRERTPTRRPWLVPAVMVLALVAMVGVAVLGSRAG